MIEPPITAKEPVVTAESFEWLICHADYILTGNFLDFYSSAGKRKKEELLLCRFQASTSLKGNTLPYYFIACQNVSPFEKQKQFLVLLRETQQAFSHNTEGGSQSYNLWPLYDHRQRPLIIELEQDALLIMSPFDQEHSLPGKEVFEYCKKITGQAELHKRAEAGFEPEYINISANSPLAQGAFAGTAGRLCVPKFMVNPTRVV